MVYNLIPTFLVLNWFHYLISSHAICLFFSLKIMCFKNSLISILSDVLIWEKNRNFNLKFPVTFFFHYFAMCLISYMELRKQTLLEISVGLQDSLEFKPRHQASMPACNTNLCITLWNVLSLHCLFISRRTAVQPSLVNIQELVEVNYMWNNFKNFN